MSNQEYYSESEDNLDENLEDFIKKTDESLKLIKKNENLDETTKFLTNYLEKELWNKNDIKNENIDESDDLDHTENSVAFEKKYNFRFEEKGSDKIESHPRKIEGEQRINENSRKRKRKEDQEEKNENLLLEQKLLDEIDEKYKKIFEEKGQLTDQDLSNYNNEISDIILKNQDGIFPYIEVPKEGGIEKSIRLLNEEDIDEKIDNKNKKNFNKKFIKKPILKDQRKSSYFLHKKK